ncbi:AraC family transcriptional regulator [Paraburkholderia hospita]|uniref:AraC family transcriptional regulator n=1 Tax=Paraburkholderia hospita TaxID=169430 RepID=UPI000271BE95|nr:AraC family transcriptional regulator [Paraburkholderia hospita]EUC15610.1 transcriptional regulator, AraC family [Burkholderia sp. BT03]SKC81758.1 transcriptional regulator, AraC family [Paraburkholderia hospita]
MPSEHADVLSQVLKLIRLRGDHVFHGELGSSTEVIFPPGPATFLHLRAGELSVSQCNGPSVTLRSGDFVLLPHADGHTIRSGPSRKARQRFEAAVDFTPSRDAQTFKWAADDGMAGSFLAGSFYFDGAPLRSLLTGLPGLIHLTCDKVSEPPWLASISHFLDVESRSAGPGSSLMISRLIDLLVIRTLRMWVSQQGDRVGWLSGLSDERVGRALNAMHLEPDRAWTVSALAETAMMSRSMFSDRFTAVVGLPPLRYLTRWRLTVAADLLRGGTLKVTEVAHRAGYGSEAAFSRAFKEEFGYPPRDAHRIAQTGAFVARSSELL